jgi:DNA-directed RNA polymerase specialized sigma subunit
MTRRPSNGAVGRQATIKRIIAEERTRIGRTPTAEEIARILGASVERTRAHLEAIEQEAGPQRKLL